MHFEKCEKVTRLVVVRISVARLGMVRSCILLDLNDEVKCFPRS